MSSRLSYREFLDLISQKDLENLKNLTAEKLALNILIVVKSKSQFDGIRTFVEKRGWSCAIEDGQKSASKGISEEKFDFVFVSFNFEGQDFLDFSFLQSLSPNLEYIGFCETSDLRTESRLTSSSFTNKFSGNLSGPSIQRKLNQMIFDKVQYVLKSAEENRIEEIEIEKNIDMSSVLLNEKDEKSLLEHIEDVESDLEELEVFENSTSSNNDNEELQSKKNKKERLLGIDLEEEKKGSFGIIKGKKKEKSGLIMQEKPQKKSELKFFSKDKKQTATANKETIDKSKLEQKVSLKETGKVVVPKNREVIDDGTTLEAEEDLLYHLLRLASYKTKFSDEYVDYNIVYAKHILIIPMKVQGENIYIMMGSSRKENFSIEMGQQFQNFFIDEAQSFQLEIENFNPVLIEIDEVNIKTFIKDIAQYRLFQKMDNNEVFVALNILNTEFPKVSCKTDGKIHISPKFIFPNTDLTFDIFLYFEYSNRYIRYGKKERQLNHIQLNRIKNSNTELLIDAREIQFFLEYYFNNLFKKFIDLFKNSQKKVS